jgi:vacuolar-type H+-ATPase subunit D/Vma8
MGRKYVDCRSFPSEMNCSIAISADTEGELLEAAVQHAVAEAAARVLAAEESATRRRLRAVTERWIPLLTSALAEARQVLEQQEREDDIRLRWAHTARSATAAGVSEEESSDRGRAGQGRQHHQTPRASNWRRPGSASGRTP